MSRKEKARGTKYIDGHVGKRRALICEGRTDGAQLQAHGSGKGVYVISIGLVNKHAKINIPQCHQGSANLLLDTGAYLNLIKLDTLSDNVKVNTDQTYSLQGIHKTPVNTTGSVLLDIHVGNSTQPTEFQVIPMGFPIPQDGIMGRPLLEQLKVVIDCNQGTLTWDIPTNEITVPPRSQVVIPVCTTNVVGDNQDILIHSQQLAEDLFCGNVLNTVQNGQVLVCIANSREEPIQMEPPHLDELSHQLLDEAQAKTIFNIRKADNRLNRIDLLQRTLRLDHTNKEERKSVENICNEYANIFHLEGDIISCTDAVQHEIKIPQSALPIHQRPFRLPYSQQVFYLVFKETLVVENTFEKDTYTTQVNELLQDGVITTSDSPWNAPLLIVPKKVNTLGEQKYRVVVDYRKLNSITIGDAFPMPNINEILDQLGRAKYFICLDMASDYH
ncbi:hypothetical protein QTP88_024005 [Uroleucon formosanum]